MRFFWNTTRVLAAIAALGAAPLAIWKSFEAEHFARYWIALVMPFVGVGLVALWYLFFGWGPFGRRARHFGIFAGVVLFAGVAFKLLLRYDGSTSGNSLPRFAWRWEAPASASIPAPPPGETASSPRPLPDGVVEGVIDSPQFYGPNRDGFWPAASVQASLDWSAEKPEILWRRPVGQGWSGFAVKGRRALTQEQRGNEELVTCYDLVTGDLLWSHHDSARYYGPADPGPRQMAGDGPRAVPTVSGEHVFACGATGMLNCLRLETGEAVWQLNILEETGQPLPEWGKSTSPLVIDDLGLVVVSAGENGPPTLLAHEIETGALAWKYDGQGASYSSPRLLTLHGIRQIVSVNAKDVSGVDPATGEELWRFSWPGRTPKVGQPIDLSDNRLLVTASYGAGSHLIQVKNDGGAWSVEPVWETSRLKTKFSSASVRDGHAYGFDEGKLACVNLADGSRVWKGGDYRFGQQLLVGDRLLIQAEDGFVAVADASPDGFRELARLDALTSLTWNPPTLAGRYLLVRNDREAICFRLPPAAAD